MLTVYTHRIPKPKDCLDFSTIPLDELCDAAIAVHDHQKGLHIWLGYIDGWMLNPREEAILRRILRKFHCSLVTHFPFALSQSWKNEIDTIYTS